MSIHRRFRPEIRAVDGSNGRQFWAMPVAYEVVDDYGTIWTRGVFDASVREKMPVLLYGHDWGNVTNVLGRAIDYRDGEDGPRTLFELTDFDQHPHTRQVAAQINEGTLVDMSVGFDRRRWLGASWGNDAGVEGPLPDKDKAKTGPHGAVAVERMLEAGWDETSLVVAGAVPGSKVLTMVRSKTRSGVAFDDVTALARMVAAEEITHAEAQAALLLLERPEPPTDETDEEEGEGDDGLADADAEAVAVLEGLEG